MADNDKHEHRPAVFSSGGTKTRRCQVCFKDMGEVEDAGAPAAPTPEPVDLGADRKPR